MGLLGRIKQTASGVKKQAGERIAEVKAERAEERQIYKQEARTARLGAIKTRARVEAEQSVFRGGIFRREIQPKQVTRYTKHGRVVTTAGRTHTLGKSGFERAWERAQAERQAPPAYSEPPRRPMPRRPPVQPSPFTQGGFNNQIGVFGGAGQRGGGGFNKNIGQEFFGYGKKKRKGAFI
jgi:hypothetical protein